MKNPHIIWASVVIVFMMICGAVVLTALDKDVNAVTNLAVLIGLPVLGAMGVGAYNQMTQTMDQIRETGNGRMTELLNTIKEMHQQQADMQQKMTEMALQVPVAPAPAIAPVTPAGPPVDNTSQVLLRSP